MTDAAPITKERRQTLLDLLPKISATGWSAERILATYRNDAAALEAALTAAEKEIERLQIYERAWHRGAGGPP